MTAKKRINKVDPDIETVLRDFAALQSPKARALIESYIPNIQNLISYTFVNDSPFNEIQSRSEKILKACWPGKGLPPKEIRRFRRVRKDNPSEIVFGWRFEPGGEFFEDPYLPARYGEFCLRDGDYVEDPSEGRTIWQVLRKRLDEAVLRSLLGVIPADDVRTFVKLVEEISSIRFKMAESLDSLEQNFLEYYDQCNQLATARNLLNPIREQYAVGDRIIEGRPPRPSAVEAMMEDERAGSVAEVARALGACPGFR